MTRLVALEWDAWEARVVTARTRGREIVFDQAFAVELTPRDPGQTFADARVGERVAAALAARGISPAQTMVAVGRASIELRLLQLPPSPPEELPDLVRFQALRQFAAIGEDWSLDFFELEGGDTESSQVLAAAISPELITQIKQACDAGELTPYRLALRPFAAASLLNRSLQVGTGTCLLLVELLADEVDLTVLVDGQVVFIRTVRQANLSDVQVQARALQGELRRTIGAVQNQLGGRRVEEIVLCGDNAEHAELKAAIEQDLSLPVRLFDPFAKLTLDGELRHRIPEHSGRFAPLLGLLADEADGERPAIDFLHPRERPKPVNQHRRNALIAAASLTLVLGIAALVGLQLSFLNANIQELQAEISANKPLLERSAELQRQLTTLEREFVDGDVNWLDELRELSADFRPPEEATVTQWTVSSRPDGGGRMLVEGFIADSGLIQPLQDGMRDTRHSVVGKGTNYDPSRDKLPWRFSETISVQAGPAPGDGAAMPAAAEEAEMPAQGSPAQENDS